MKVFILALSFLVAPVMVLQAQDGYYHDFDSKRTTGKSGTGDNIDVNYYRCDWTIDPRTTSKTITGTVTTYFTTTTTNVNTIKIDLNSGSFNNSSLVVKYHGTTCTRSLSSNILTITLPVTIATKGTLDSLSISYSGNPPNVSGAAQGYQRGKDGNNINYVNTLSESYEDRDWWPCKADMQDKPDSMDLIVKVPWASSGTDTFWVAANGKMIDSTISGGWRTFHFKTKYPTASYLVGISVARFNRYYRTVNINGTTVPVVYNLLAGKTSSYYTNAVNAMDKINQVIVKFSEKFGDYPFKDEKHGFYDGLLGAGGMEHQTFSAIAPSALTSLGTLTHELMHQWFGDKVTFSTWNDLWLAEGFARYSEALGPELLPAVFGSNPSSIRLGWKNSSKNSYSSVGAWIPNSSMGNSDAIWNTAYGGAVYDRGAMVVSMLRTLLGDDKFFEACRNYLNDPLLAYGSAKTSDLQRHMEAVIGGFSLQEFFDSYVTGNGYPIYTNSNSIQWQAIGSTGIRFGVVGQGRSAGSNVSYYASVLPIRVQGAGGKDTLIVLYDRGSLGVSVGGHGIDYGNSPTPEIYLGWKPTSVTFDPYNMSLVDGSVMAGTVMATHITEFNVTRQNDKDVATLKIEDYNNVKNVSLESSKDGNNFIFSAAMQSGANGTYTTSLLSSGSTYYRAKVVMQGGEIIYSDIRHILRNEESAKASLLNNPVKNTLRIKLASNGRNSVHGYTIMDMSGKTLQRSGAKFSGDVLEVNVESLPRGTHVLQIQCDTGNQTIQFIKE